MAVSRPASFDDLTRHDYPQPNCPLCGRFARRRGPGQYGWEFGCGARFSDGAWQH